MYPGRGTHTLEQQFRRKAGTNDDRQTELLNTLHRQSVLGLRTILFRVARSAEEGGGLRQYGSSLC
jgi:hypothetical protein